jgi:hypothetical protein
MSEPQTEPAVPRARFLPPCMVASYRNLVDPIQEETTPDSAKEEKTKSDTEPLNCIHTVVVAFYKSNTYQIKISMDKKTARE